MIRTLVRALVVAGGAAAVACTAFGSPADQPGSAVSDAAASPGDANADADAGVVTCEASVSADFTGGAFPPGLAPTTQYVGGMVASIDTDAGEPAPAWSVELTETTGIRRNCLFQRVNDPSRCLSLFRFSSRITTLANQQWGLSIGAVDFADGSHYLIEVSTDGTSIVLSERLEGEPARYIASEAYPRTGEWFAIELRLSADPRNRTPRFFVAGREITVSPAILAHDRVESFCVGVVDADPSVTASMAFDNVAFR